MDPRKYENGSNFHYTEFEHKSACFQEIGNVTRVYTVVVLFSNNKINSIERILIGYLW